MGTEAPAGSTTEDKESPGHSNRDGNDPLPIFMLCTSVSEVLVRKQKQSRWQMAHLQAQHCGGPRTLASSVPLLSMSGCTSPGGGSYLRVSASMADTLDFGPVSTSCSDDILVQGRAFARCLSDSAAIREECKLPIQSGGDPPVNQDKSHQCQNLQGNSDIG